MRRRHQAVAPRPGPRGRPAGRAPPRLAERLSRAALGLVLHEEATDVARRRGTSPTDGDVVVVVGPEGGITDTELAALHRRRWPGPVRLGAEVLRSSTAGPAALAVLASAARWR